LRCASSSRAGLQAWNTHDLDAIVECCTEDIVMHDPAMFGDLARGRDAFRRFCEIFLRALPDVWFEPVGSPYIAAEGARIAAPWRMRGTFIGKLAGWPPEAPLPVLAPTRRQVDIEGIDLYEFRDTRICWWRLHYDLLDLCQQLGLLPAVRSRAIGVLAPAQRVAAALMRRRRPPSPVSVHRRG
jgi:predicted ester cyclase